MRMNTGYKRLALTLLALMGLLLTAPKREPPAQRVLQVQTKSERTLIIDAGHGGEDGGAVAVSGTPESQINLDIALRVDQLCGLYGVKSRLLRETDVSLAGEETHTLREKKRSDLKQRVEQVNSVPGAVLLSIHQNYYESPVPHGAQVFYRPDENSQCWAETLQTALREYLDPENSRIASPVPEFVYLMKHISCPAVLVECGFLSNPEENQRLESAAYQKMLAAVLTASCLVRGQ